MISDFVKGKKKFEYPLPIRKGIALHRNIDRFTDEHTATKEAKQVFRPVYRLYSGAFVDVVYDHFLATDPSEFTESSLLDFTRIVYTQLEEQTQWFPERFAFMFPYMKAQNWLYNYRTTGGTEKSLGGVVRRSVYLSDSQPAFHLFQVHYQRLGDCYRHFWKDLKKFALDSFEQLQHDPDPGR
jgi:acyl carrier protein phosphodiesterase